MIKCRLRILPREFTSVIIAAVYISPQATTETALSDLYKDLNSSQTSNPDAALNVAAANKQKQLKQSFMSGKVHLAHLSLSLSIMSGEPSSM